MSGRDCHTMADTECHGALLNWPCQVDKCLVVTVTPWQILNVTVRCKLFLSGGQVSGRDCHTMADTECHGAL